MKINFKLITSMFVALFLLPATFSLIFNQKAYTASEETEYSLDGHIAAPDFLSASEKLTTFANIIAEDNIDPYSGQPMFSMDGLAYILTLNNPITVTITAGSREEVVFTAPADGTYEFESSDRGTLDPKAYVNLTGSPFYNDDSGKSLNYKFQQTITSGQVFTYYSGVYNDNMTSNGNYTVTVVKIKENRFHTVSLEGWTYGQTANNPSVSGTVAENAAIT
ncbi:MAG: hypothetical protein FWG51_06255, partial [Firmicutes bacterium]|nr:hypothetical protein [Bacillota bacterium]